jgi:hypothetical protein
MSGTIRRSRNGGWHCTACLCCGFPYNEGHRCEVSAGRASRAAVIPSSAELRARAERFKPLPIPVYKEVPAKDWQDTSHDRWGAPARGPQLLGRQWTNGNCLRACVASMLNADIARVPDPSSLYNRGGPWFDAYSKQVADKTGYRLERLPLSLCPPRDPNRLWIAGISFPDHDADHVVCARGHYVVFDPLGEFYGQLPWQRVIDGMLLAPTRRVVPVFSPGRNGYTVVAA